MAKFLYYVIHLDGQEPQGTNDTELAQRIADTEDQAWVIDAETGTTLDDCDVEEVNPKDYEDADEGDNGDEATDD